jgi:hypothetical protein
MDAVIHDIETKIATTVKTVREAGDVWSGRDLTIERVSIAGYA